MKEMGALPSWCSGAMTTTPWLDKEPRRWLYAFRVPPRPWENTRTGHREDEVGGCKRGALVKTGRAMWLRIFGM